MRQVYRILISMAQLGVCKDKDAHWTFNVLKRYSFGVPCTHAAPFGETRKKILQGMDYPDSNTYQCRLQRVKYKSSTLRFRFAEVSSCSQEEEKNAQAFCLKSGAAIALPSTSESETSTPAADLEDMEEDSSGLSCVKHVSA